MFVSSGVTDSKTLNLLINISQCFDHVSTSSCFDLFLFLGFYMLLFFLLWPIFRVVLARSATRGVVTIGDHLP